MWRKFLVALNAGWIAALIATCMTHNVSVGAYVFTELGTTLRDLELNRAAIASYSAAVYFAPNASRVHGARAYTYYQAGAFDRSISGYTDVMQLEGRSALRLRQRASALFEAGRLHEALSDYNASITIDPNDAINYAGRASIYIRLRAFKRAVKDYSAAIALEPTEMAHVYHRARSYIEAKRFDFAYADLIAIVQRDPDSYWAKHAMITLNEVANRFRARTPSRRKWFKAPLVPQIAI